MAKYTRLFFALTILIGLGYLGFAVLGEPSEVVAAHEPNLAGWAWSSNIGWFSFNCKDRDICAGSDYGVNLNEVTGELSGYAWANPRDAGAGTNNIGWISFNSVDLAGCPAAPCEAKLDLASNQLKGWARAIRGADGNGGWVGWVSLNCATSGNAGTCGLSNYFVDYDPATKKFGDFAWGGGDNANGSGDEVIGWMDWDPNCPGGCEGVHVVTNYELTVTKSGQGTVTSVNDGDENNDGEQDINCGPDCTETYNSPTLVWLSATADPGNYFIGWTDEDGNQIPGCENPQNNCQVDVNEPKTVRANFRKSACNDGIDNDVPPDGLIDFNGGPGGELADPGCVDINDDSENNPPPAQCNDGIDNDNDGLIDYPNDPGCSGPDDDDETDLAGCPDGPNCPKCNDGIDNDADDKIDYAGCYGVYDPVLQTNVCTGDPSDTWFEKDNFCRDNPDGGRESFSNDRYEI